MEKPYSIKEELKALGSFFLVELVGFLLIRRWLISAAGPIVNFQVSEIVRSTGPNKFDFIYEEELKAMIEPFPT